MIDRAYYFKLKSQSCHAQVIRKSLHDPTPIDTLVIKAVVDRNIENTSFPQKEDNRCCGFPLSD